MQEAEQQSLSDIQKNIVLSYLPMNPEILETSRLSQKMQKMVEELNASCDRIQDYSIWSVYIKRWKDIVRKDYWYTKKLRRNVFSIEDLQLLLHMKDSLDDTAEKLIKHENEVTCGTCLANIDEQETCNLFTTSVDDHHTLGSLLNSFTRVFTVKQDELPPLICFQCSKTLKMMHNFRQMCEKNSKHLLQEVAVIEQSMKKSYEPLDVKNWQDVFNDFVPKGELANEENDEVQDSYKNLHQSDRSDYEAHSPKDNSKIENLSITYIEIEEPEERSHDKASENPIKKPKLKNKKNRTNIQRSKKKPEKKPVKPKVNYICYHCNKSFPLKYKLSGHMQVHKTDRPYVCDTCGKCFKKTGTLKGHMATHKTERNFHCKHCSYTAKVKSNLMVHNRIHLDKKLYKCDICDKSFMTSSNRLKHIRVIHNNIRAFKCPLALCDKTFQAKRTANEHMVVHTGTKSYHCHVCNSSYGWYHRLREHIQKQHPGVEIPKDHFGKLL